MYRRFRPTFGPSRTRISLRFFRYLLWEFRWPLIVFTSLVMIGGYVLHRFYHHEELNYAQACHAVFLMIFMESAIDFPDEWYLQPFFFLIPIVGLGAVADSVVRLAYLIFTRKNKLPEWHRMVASLYRNHVVVIGAGKVGYRIVLGLLDLRESVVVIERVSDSLLLDEILDLGVTVIRGDARQNKILEQAGVPRAQAVIVATDDDLANLDCALTARDMNPEARIVVRLFDDTLAVKFGSKFSIPAVSTAHVSAPAFIGAATGRRVYQEFQLAGKSVHLTDLTIQPGGGLVGRTVGEIQADKQVNIVMHHGSEGDNLNPAHSVVLDAEDMILVIAPCDRLVDLERINQDGARPRPGPVAHDTKPRHIVGTIRSKPLDGSE